MDQDEPSFVLLDHLKQTFADKLLKLVIYFKLTTNIFYSLATHYYNLFVVAGVDRSGWLQLGAEEAGGVGAERGRVQGYQHHQAQQGLQVTRGVNGTSRYFTMCTSGLGR